MKKTSNKTTVSYFIFIWIVAAFLLESSDLWISVNLYNPASYWARLLEKYGEIPGLLVILIAIHIYIVTLKESSNIKTILFTSFLLTTASLVTIYMLWAISLAITGNPAFFNYNEIYFFVAAIIANIFTSLLFKKHNKFSKKSILFSRLTFKMFFYGYLVIIQPLKIFWGRIRFRDLAENYSNFTAWYIPNGITGNQSFPSGHAAMGFILMALFIFIMDKSFFKRIFFKAIIISYAIAVCISRIIVGAHYTSDVLFGAMIMIISYLLIKQNINKTLKN
ncbi:MAG TPA: phosphatase PAP2 family protein [Ignavibacteriaceae bacterium]|nr:phosphatase PAP2 family protein [Ignavibacteriaceae bacterium]HQI41931.1 phosphatase PAP2 family protein [Ignavibacteriaceae bacterium]